MTVPVSTFVHRSPLRLEWKIHLHGFLGNDTNEECVLCLCNSSNWFCFGSVLFGQHLTLRWPHQILAAMWHWVDRWNLICLQGWPKISPSRCILVAHPDVLMSTEIACLKLRCALAFFSRRRYMSRPCLPCYHGWPPQQLVYYQH